MEELMIKKALFNLGKISVKDFTEEELILLNDIYNIENQNIFNELKDIIFE